MYASGSAANTARSARSSYRMCSGRSPASVGRTKTGCKIPAYPLTDRLQFDTLQRGPGWRGWNAIRSTETARVHHAARRRGNLAGGGARLAARKSHTSRAKGHAMAKNTICLWYDKDAEAAARFYAETFPDSAVGAVHRAPSDYPSGKQGDVLIVEFTVAGIPCI